MFPRTCSQNCGNSFGGNALLFLFLFVLLLLTAQFILVPAEILKNYGVHCASCPLRKMIKASCFLYLCPNIYFLHHKYAKKGFYKEFALLRSFVAILWIIEVGGTCKMNIEIALKSRSYILGLDHVKLSLGIFFFYELFNGKLFHLLSGSTFIFVKKTDQKSPNFTFQLILPAEMVLVWFLGVR